MHSEEANIHHTTPHFAGELRVHLNTLNAPKSQRYFSQHVDLKTKTRTHQKEHVGGGMQKATLLGIAKFPGKGYFC